MTTPFAEVIRRMRAERGISQKQMAEALGVSSAYLSALEHGKRGAPSFDFLQRVAGYFGIIWDDAENLIAIAGQSHPRVVVDTSGLPPQYTLLANHLAKDIGKLDLTTVRTMLELIEKAAENQAQQKSEK